MGDISQFRLYPPDIKWGRPDSNQRPPAPEVLAINPQHTAGVKLDGFDAYLRKVLTSDKDITYLAARAKKYYHVLADGNASELLAMTHDMQRQTMRALSHLAKFNGRYEAWQRIIKNHALHWRHTDDNFNFFEKENINEMMVRIKAAIEILPKDCANTLVVDTLLGLRADEACKAIGLIKQGANDYYNKERGILEHYRYKDLFIRRSKKAYISLVDDDLLALVKQSSDSYHSIRSYLKRRKVPMPMRYCRKVFATYLRQHGVETEFIDLLQGRTPASIFGRHYYRPDFDQQATKIRRLLPRLKRSLLS